MSDLSKMSNQAILSDTSNATSLRESESGALHFAMQDGQTLDLFGRVPARVNLSARQAKAMGLLTSGTYGPPSTGLSKSVSLQSSLESKLREHQGANGSILYRLTWKPLVTPSGRQLLQQQARALHIFGSGYTGLPTPVSSEIRDKSRPQVLAKLDKGGRVARWICSRSSTALSCQEIVTLNPCFAREMMGLPQAWADCMPMETQSMLRKRKSLLRA